MVCHDCVYCNETVDYRDTAGQERFRTLTNAYFRGAAVSIACVYLVTDNVEDILYQV